MTARAAEERQRRVSPRDREKRRKTCVGWGGDGDYMQRIAGYLEESRHI
jgi:hypothetical protein